MILELHWLRGHLLLNEEQLFSLKGLMIALMKMRVNENGLLCFCTQTNLNYAIILLKKYHHTHAHL